MAREYWYKGWQITDTNKKLEAVAVSGEPATFGETSYGTTASVTEKGSNASYTISIPVIMQKGFSTPSETYDAWFKRKLTFAKNVKTVKGTNGDFVVISEADTDRTLTTNAETAGSAVAIELDADISAVVNDYLFITDAIGNWEVAQITGYTATPAVATIGTLVNSYASGATAAKVNWYLPNSYLMSEISVSPSDEAQATSIDPIELVFQGVDDPTWN